MIVYYAIRHIKSQKFMPLMSKGRGYSHWNPDKNEEPKASLGMIRFLKTAIQANLVIKAWYNYPNSHISGHQNHLGDYDEDLAWKDDGRQLEDLEVVTFEITEAK